MLTRVIRAYSLVNTIITRRQPLSNQAAKVFSPKQFSSKRESTMTTRVVEPTGEYAQIESQIAMNAMKVLLKPDSEIAQQTMIDAVIKEPNKYAPPVFCALSAALLVLNKPEDAAFWFYAGQLRARYDSMRCADETAGSAVSVLNQQYGIPINRYMFAHLDALKALVPKVVEFDRKTPHDYDHRWINLHGMGAFTNEAVLSVPKETWPEIEEQARQNYLNGFKEMLDQLPPS